MSEADFRSLYRRLRDTAPGGGTRRGALETITGAQVLAAVREVRSGRTVSLTAPVNTRIAPDDADPAEYRPTAPAGGRPRASGLDFPRDR
ncbi:hypothetical protein [Streptomyces sp. NPDC101165]|uniref:hypothetical protein n=1 Tax=Streptomyces sp. NPDC101165 TaxID=3366119 RepID=UPI003820FC53